MAGTAFADAVPTTAAGALAKIRPLLDEERESDPEDRCLNTRHLRTVIAYLEQQAAA